MGKLLDRLMRPAIFGVFDGSTSVLSILLAYRHLDGLIFPGALALGAVSAVGMAAGEYLSDDTDSGFAASAVIGVATGLGTVAPAAPYLLLHGAAAAAGALLVLLAIGALIAGQRAKRHRWPRALVETYGVLIVASVAAVVCTLAVPAGAG
jgi:VIT1/CCC1 family predicted Fe2+/Mn2+ transporter